MMVYKGISFINGSTNLRPEFCRRFGFSSDDRAHMWLEDADYSVFALMFLLFKHLQLLGIHVEGGSEDALLMRLQNFFATSVLKEEFCKFAEILVQIA